MRYWFGGFPSNLRPNYNYQDSDACYNPIGNRSGVRCTGSIAFTIDDREIIFRNQDQQNEPSIPILT